MLNKTNNNKHSDVKDTKNVSSWTFKEKLFCVTALLIVSVCMLMERAGYKNREIKETESYGVNNSLSGTENKKTAFLTFDDGPSTLTASYLDILKEEGAKATFFIIGQQVDDDMSRIINREIDEGHEIGIHTYCHEANVIYATEDSCYKDVMKIKDQLERQFNYEAKLVRFPWGSANGYISPFRANIIDRIHKSGLEYEDWNVSAEDSVGTPTVDSILNNVRKDYKKYDEPVILMHDSGCNKKTLEALRTIIRELKADGYSFGTLSERENPCHFLE